MNKSRFFFLTIVLVLSFGTTAQASNLWLHVRVEEPDNNEKVKVNIPLSLVEAAMPIVEGGKHLEHARLHLDEHGFSVADLRELWQTVRAQGDVLLAQVTSSDEGLRVFIEGDDLMVESIEAARHQIHVRVPARLVDALLSGSGEELNVRAALESLQALGSREIASVRGDGTTVRVWIDESSTGN